MKRGYDPASFRDSPAEQTRGSIKMTKKLSLAAGVALGVLAMASASQAASK
jgi:hypothetical protein